MKKSNLHFDRIVGQEKLIGRLAGELAGGRMLQHAYLLTGPEGIGKRTLATAFAAAILCEQRKGPEDNCAACGVCPSCRYFGNLSHPDFKWLAKDEDRLIKVERVRQEVVADLQLKPQLGAYKVYLIEAGDLNEQGQNVLLKSLEEPPEYAVFILTCDRAERLLPTIRSRVAELQLRRLIPAEMDRILDDADRPDDWAFIRQYAAGIPGVALELHSSDWFNELRRETHDLFFRASAASRTELLTTGYKQIDAQKEHLAIRLDLWQSLIRDMMVLLSGEATHLNHPDYRSRMEELLKLYRFPQGAAGEEARRQRLMRLTDLAAAMDELRQAMQVNASFEGMIGQLLLAMRRALTVQVPAAAQ